MPRGISLVKWIRLYTKEGAMSGSNGDDKKEGISLGNILLSGEDVILHYEFIKMVLDFAQRNELMSHKVIGLLEATKHGLCTYTDMVCVTNDPTEDE